MASVATTEPRPATPDEIWALFRETAEWHAKATKLQEETVQWRKDWEERQVQRQLEAEQRQAEADQQQREADRRQREAYQQQRLEDHKKWEERFEREKAETRALFAEAAAVVKANGEQIGGLNNSFGELAEHLVAPGILERFGELGYHFDRIRGQKLKIPGKEPGSVLTEVDILLENDQTVIAVEVKARPRVSEKKPEKDHIARHVRRLEILREYRESEGKPEKPILGAIAGAVFDKAAKDAAHKAGFFVIVQTGDTMRIETPKDFKPREW